MPLPAVLSLIAALWLVGLLALRVPAAPWLALLLYALGTLALALVQIRRLGSASLLLTGGPHGRASLLAGLLAGGLLAGAALPGMAGAGAARARDLGLALPVPPLPGALALPDPPWLLPLLLLPLLVLVEELLWRGLLLTALERAGLSAAAIVALTTAGYSLNHLAVAPLPLPARLALAAMALPLGVVNAVLTLRSRCLWGALLAHAVTMAAMVAVAPLTW